MKSLVASLALLVGFSTAQASMVSYNVNYGPEAAASPNHVVGMLPLFDPGLGTLTKVTLTLDSTTSGGTIAWDNEAPTSTNITLGIGAEVTVTAQSLLTAVALPLQTGSAMGVDADNDGAADFIGTDSFSVVGGSGMDSDMDMSTAPATLLAFTGLGTFNVELASGVETFLSTSGGFGPIDPVPGVTQGTVTVTYEYVPEPATALMFVFGGIALIRRRR
ncbi:MAG: choice-of-anchor E domain-containing protein [Phycisphaerales bacterium]|nr:choice-of-anchor E domain-containing protein [Phycisphaerales bacterium]MCB9858765.1 choice-of-anchor E domain-containing protein [Phycisphaerales bacterium]